MQSLMAGYRRIFNEWVDNLICRFNQRIRFQGTYCNFYNPLYTNTPYDFVDEHEIYKQGKKWDKILISIHYQIILNPHIIHEISVEKKSFSNWLRGSV